MPAAIISGKDIALTIRDELNARVASLAKEGLVPGLATVLVGEDPASRLYVGMKQRAAAEAGIHSRSEPLSATTSEAELLALIDELNADPAIHGILVQLPLPRHIDDSKVLLAVDPDKDVGRLPPGQRGAPGHRRPRRAGALHPARRDRDAAEERRRSPRASTWLSWDARTSWGSRWRSCCCAKPAGGNATVTVAHSRTANLGTVTRHRRHPDCCGGVAQHRHPRHGEAGCHRHRRGHQPDRRSRSPARIPGGGGRRLRGRARGGRRDHAGARRRGPDDHRHAPCQHG